MEKRDIAKRILLPALLALVLALAGCTAAAPAAEPAVDAAAEPATGSEEGATEEAEEAPVTSQEVITSVVEQSGAARGSVEAGAQVTSDEDVTTPRSDYGGEYHDVSSADAVSFHPYMVQDTASRSYQAMVYSGALLRLDEQTLEYIPNMAESYSISEDGLTFTFNVRQGMQWSDGEPLTAQDFKWTYDQVINPENEYPYISQLDFIESYEALDDYTIQVKIKEVYAPALGQMSGLITPLPRHVWESLDWKDPELNPEINAPSVVSGPFKLAEWQRDQFVRFETNESYWYKGRPNLDSYLLEIVPSQDVAYEKMRSGESDTGEITPERLEEARTLENINVYEWWPAAARWSYIGLNMREGHATSDLNVRRGLSYALDKQAMTDEIMEGQAKRLCGPFPETSWVYNPDVECYEYDVDAALAEFEQAGYTFDGERMVNADGEQLSLTLIFGPNTNQTRELMAVATQDYLSQIGIAVEIQALEWATFLEELTSPEPTWDMHIGGWSATIEPHIMYTIWAESSIPDLNSVGYVNADVEQLFAEGGATYDTEARKEKYMEAQRLIVEDAPYIFLFYNKSWAGINKRIAGIEPTALGIGWNLEDWYVQDAGQ